MAYKIEELVPADENGVTTYNLTDEDTQREVVVQFSGELSELEETASLYFDDTPDENTEDAPTVSAQIASLATSVDNLTECVLEMSEQVYA